MNRNLILPLGLIAFLASCTDPGTPPEDVDGEVESLPTPIVEKDGLDLETIRHLPVQADRRYQPLDTFARVRVREVTGKHVFHDTHPILLLLHWRTAPHEALAGRYIKMPPAEVAEALGLETPTAEVGHTSAHRVKACDALRALLPGIQDKVRHELELDAVEAGASALWKRASILEDTVGVRSSDHESARGPLAGHLPIIPPREAAEPGVPYAYLSPHELLQSAWPAARKEAVTSALAELQDAFVDADAGRFQSASEDLLAAIAAMEPEKDAAYPGMGMIEREVRFNDLAPFSVLRFFYFGVLVLGLLALPFRSRLLWGLPLAALAGTLGFHVWAIVERTVISERAMIGNLYESAIFVAAAAAVLTLVFELVWRQGWITVAGSFLSMLALFWAQSDPGFWRPEISKLNPVLINNSLIHIHVPTIMTSYAALALTVVLGHVYLFSWWFCGGSSNPGDQEWLRRVARFMFWTIPVGVILLFAGIILGGVWADASWGRFWGNDPKEVASAVTWLVFVIIIHGRWAGWLLNLGTALGTMFGGLALIWTYWGANFYQTGLHSYAGAGTDIPTWPYWYLGIEAVVAAVTLVLWLRRRG